MSDRMIKIVPEDHSDAALSIDPASCGAIYPLSVSGNIQPGDVYRYGDSFLFWHYCGFAFAFGACDEEFLNCVYQHFLSPESSLPRRFVLFGNSAKVTGFLENKNDLVSQKRYFYEYPAGAVPESISLPEGFQIHEIDGDLSGRLEGRITPWFSWDSASDFLERGKGYCITDGNIPAAWSFSAAISQEEIDIGIETAPGYRRRGLASAAARLMISYSLSQNKRPVWSCVAENTGSVKTAESLGFVRTSECMIFRK